MMPATSHKTPAYCLGAAAKAHMEAAEKHDKNDHGGAHDHSSKAHGHSEAAHKASSEAHGKTASHAKK
jgi:hypothetical protein